MAQVAAGVGSAAALAQVALDIARAVREGHGDFQVPNINRDEFAKSVARHYHYAGFNVAVVHPSSSGSGQASDFSMHPKWGLSTISYKVYLGVPGNRMVVTNHGDGGFINWAYHGNVQQRDGGTVIMI